MTEEEKKNPDLTDHVEELENLVDKKPGQSRVSVVGDQVIPILDELVSNEDNDIDVESNHHDEDDDPHYDQIVEQVEEKLSHELDEIVNLLKGNLKDSILQELQDKIKKDSSNDSKE